MMTENSERRKGGGEGYRKVRELANDTGVAAKGTERTDPCHLWRPSSHRERKGEMPALGAWILTDISNCSPASTLGGQITV